MERKDKLLNDLVAQLNVPLTDEQVEYIKAMKDPTICTACPGTGKTHATVVGLLSLNLIEGIPGDRINCCSFTNAATDEIAGRYINLCKRHRFRPTVKFNTFHAICKNILQDHFKKKDFIVGSDKGLESTVEYMQLLFKMYSVYGDKKYAAQFVDTIDDLNGKLIFTENRVVNTLKFQKLKVDFELFTLIRQKVMINKLTTKEVLQGDLPLYALYILSVDDKIKEDYGNRYDVFVVDEGQDLPLLSVKILSMITKRLILIGDMNQQIYGFAGAHPKVVEAYKMFYPGCNEVSLTKSFRCPQDIADFATTVIQENYEDGVSSFEAAFKDKGMDNITIHASGKFSIDDYIDGIVERSKVKHTESTMFIVRNNYSIVPILEKLYQRGVPYNVRKFPSALNLPVYRDLNMYLNLFRKDSEYVDERTGLCRYEIALNMLHYLIPEFRNYGYGQNPIAQIYKSTGKKFFDITKGMYDFREPISQQLVELLIKAKKANKRGASVGELYEMLLPYYEEHVYPSVAWRIPNEISYYTMMIRPLVHKSYRTLKDEEDDKYALWHDNYNPTGVGVKCYTAHSCKGLESDYVFMLDVDEDVYPGIRKLREYVKAGCYDEASTALRNERNLLYVGMTRAVSKLIISTNKIISSLISKEKDFSAVDKHFFNSEVTLDDIPAFLKLFRLEDRNDNYEGRPEELS